MREVNRASSVSMRELRIPWGNCWVQRFGRVLRTNRGVSARECAEALGKASASPFQSVRNKKLRQLFQ